MVPLPNADSPKLISIATWLLIKYFQICNSIFIGATANLFVLQTILVSFNPTPPTCDKVIMRVYKQEYNIQ